MIHLTELGNPHQHLTPCSQVMTDVAGNPEEERRAEFYHQPWSQEAVSRYFYCKVGEALDKACSSRASFLALTSSPVCSLLL